MKTLQQHSSGATLQTLSDTATWLNPKNCTSKLNLESCFFPMHIALNYSLCPIFSLNINHLIFMPYSHRSYTDAVSLTRRKSTCSLIKQEEGNCGNINDVTFSRPCFLEIVLSLPFLMYSFSCS